MKRILLTICCMILTVGMLFPVTGLNRAEAAPEVPETLEETGSTDTPDPSDPSGTEEPEQQTEPGHVLPDVPAVPDTPVLISTDSAALSEEGKIQVRWEGVTCTGYQVMYAPDRYFKRNCEKKLIKSATATKTVLGSLKKGERYYIKVRAYIDNVDKKGKTKRVYGLWSKYKIRIAHKHEYKDKGVMPATCTEGSKIVRVCKNKQCQAASIKKGSEMEKGHSVVPGEEEGTWYCEECGLDLKYFEAGGVTYVAPLNAKLSKIDVFVTNKAGKRYHYKIYEQDDRSIFPTYKAFIDSHGCGVCALTSALNAHAKGLADYTPDKVISVCEKKVFGSSKFNANYKKSIKKQRPVSVYGMAKIFKHYGVKYKYVYKFTEAQAVAQITKHLKKGEPVVFTLRGRSSSSSRFVGSVHSMIMLCLDEKGRVVVGDSVNRPSKWGNAGRLKYGGTVKELVHFMRSNGKSSSVYWNGSKGNACYVLVNP